MRLSSDGWSNWPVAAVMLSDQLHGRPRAAHPGRVTAATQSTSGTSYGFSYLLSSGAASYNLIDEITSMTMPSGRKVTMTYDSKVRPSALNEAYGSSNTSYVSSVSYAPLTRSTFKSPIAKSYPRCGAQAPATAIPTCM